MTNKLVLSSKGQKITFKTRFCACFILTQFVHFSFLYLPSVFENFLFHTIHSSTIHEVNILCHENKCFNTHIHNNRVSILSSREHRVKRCVEMLVDRNLLDSRSSCTCLQHECDENKREQSVQTTAKVASANEKGLPKITSQSTEVIE